MTQVNTNSLQEVIFQVVHTEGSVIVSCARSIGLNLIQIHSVLNATYSDCRKIICSCVDGLDKHKYKNMESSVHICDNASAREVQPSKEPKVIKTDVAQWKKSVIQENKKQKCQAQDNIVCSGKKSQVIQFMRPAKPPNTYAVSDQL